MIRLVTYNDFFSTSSLLFHYANRICTTKRKRIYFCSFSASSSHIGKATKMSVRKLQCRPEKLHHNSQRTKRMVSYIVSVQIVCTHIHCQDHGRGGGHNLWGTIYQCGLSYVACQRLFPPKPASEQWLWHLVGLDVWQISSSGNRHHSRCILFKTQFTQRINVNCITY